MLKLLGRGMSPAKPGVPGPPFSMDNIFGLQLWLDASDTTTITDTAGSVSQWDDKSGLGNHCAQATPAEQYTTGSRTQNGLNVLDGVSGNNMDGVNLGLSTYTIVSAFVRDSNSLTNNTISKVSGKNDALFGSDTDTVKDYAGGDKITSIDTVTIGDVAIAVNTHSGALATLYLNGLIQGTASYTMLTGGASYQIGAFGGFANQDQALLEIAVFNRVISISEINQIGSHLSSKWGV